MFSRILEPEVMGELGAAAEYDAMDHSAADGALVERLVSLGGRGRILDVGTGPGQIPLLVAQRIRNCTIVGVDLAVEMLSLARQKIAAAGLGDRVSFQFADAKLLPFANESFDTVVSNSALHHILDPHLFLGEAVRVLRPGGALLIRDLVRPATQAELDHLVRTYAAVPSICNQRQQDLFRASLMASLRPDELRQIVQNLALPDLKVVVEDDRHMVLQRPGKRTLG